MNLLDAPIAHEGFFATHFFTVSDQDNSKDFYVRILGGKAIKPGKSLPDGPTPGLLPAFPNIGSASHVEPPTRGFEAYRRHRSGRRRRRKRTQQRRSRSRFARITERRSTGATLPSILDVRDAVQHGVILRGHTSRPSASQSWRRTNRRWCQPAASIVRHRISRQRRRLHTCSG
jgi:hypothetical protein